MFRESKLTLILRRDIRIFHAWKIKITRHGQAKPLTIFERINNQPTNQPTNQQTNTSKPAHKLFTCSRKKNFNHITITPIMFFFRYPKTTHLPKKKHHLFHPAHPPPPGFQVHLPFVARAPNYEHSSWRVVPPQPPKRLNSFKVGLGNQLEVYKVGPYQL